MENISQINKKTCLYDNHVALGAIMAPFAGFEMPIQYEGIKEEHLAVRNNVGMFDVSHMGEVSVKGPDAEIFVQHIFTNDIENAPVGKVFYGMMCYEDGGTVDDLLVYKMGENDFFLVVNAANIDKDVEELKALKLVYKNVVIASGTSTPYQTIVKIEDYLK